MLRLSEVPFMCLKTKKSKFFELPLEVQRCFGPDVCLFFLHKSFVENTRALFLQTAVKE